MQQQSRVRRLPSLHAIGRSRCVDLEDTPSEPAWLPTSNHDLADKVDDDDDDDVIPHTRYADEEQKC